MLTKHGFFHLIEAQSTEEILQFMNEKQFIITHKDLLNDKLKKLLAEKKHFIVLSPAETEETILLSAYFGVKHIVSFPYSSKSIVEKISSLLNY